MIHPKIHPIVERVIKSSDDILNIAKDSDAPIRIVFPQVMSENIDALKKTIETHDVSYQIQYAHKASKSKTFIKQALESEVGIDVASLNELEEALIFGFPSSKISCTGPKSDAFLHKAIDNKTTISIDSVSELNRLVAYVYGKCKPTKVNILIRLSSIPTRSKKILALKSRFGVGITELDNIYSILDNRNLIVLKGFHYHHDGFDAPTKAEYLSTMITLLLTAKRYGYKPNTLNIGGSFRGITLADSNEWVSYINTICSKLKEGVDPGTWSAYPYGIRLDTHGKVHGREKAVSMGSQEDASVFLDSILNSTVLGNNIGQVLADSFVSLMIEPGYALVFNAGLTVLKIIDVKNAGEARNVVVTNGNMYTLGSRMYEPLADPILIPASRRARQSWSGYVVGNLCREDDFIMQRKVETVFEPEIGDLLVFPNTGAYADFEDATPILQNQCENYSCIVNHSAINITKE